MAEITIKYDGKWPCLCNGHLIVDIDGKRYDFGEGALCSGGSCRFDEDWNSEIEHGPWTIDEDYYPKDFPEEFKEELLEKINEEIDWGCCGGCL